METSVILDEWLLLDANIGLPKLYRDGPYSAYPGRMFLSRAVSDATLMYI